MLNCKLCTRKIAYGDAERPARYYPGSTLIPQESGDYCERCERSLAGSVQAAMNQLAADGFPLIFRNDSDYAAARARLATLRGVNCCACHKLVDRWRLSQDRRNLCVPCWKKLNAIVESLQEVEA